MFKKNVFLRPMTAVLCMVFLLALLPLQSMAAELDVETKGLAKQLINEYDDMSSEATNFSILNVMADIDAMEDHYIDTDLISIQEVDQFSNITYKYEMLEDVTSYVDVKENEDGSTIFHFVEGDKENTLSYSADGKMYLDGNQITVSTFESINTNSANYPVSRAAGFEKSYQTSCPVGTSPSQYTGAKTFVTSSQIINFGQSILGMTVGALAGIVATIFFGGQVQIGASIASAIASFVISLCQSRNINAYNGTFVDYKRGLSPQNGLTPHYRHETTWTVAGVTLNPVYFYEVNYPR